MEKKHYDVWVKDMDGNENFWAALLTSSEAEELQGKLQLIKGEAVAEFVVVQSEPEDYSTLTGELNEWLEDWDVTI